MQSVFLVAVAAIVRQQGSPSDEFGPSGDTSMFISQTGDSNFWGNPGESFSEGMDSDEMAGGELGSLDLAPIAEESAGERAGMLGASSSDEELPPSPRASGERLALQDAPARSLTASQGERLALERAEQERLGGLQLALHSDSEDAPARRTSQDALALVVAEPWPTGAVLEICPIGGSDRDCGKQLKTLMDHVNEPVPLKGVVVHGRYAAFKILGLQGNGKPGTRWSGQAGQDGHGGELWREHLESHGVPVLWFNKDEAAMTQVEQALGDYAWASSGDRWFSGSAMGDYRAFVEDPASAATRPGHGNIRKIA